MPVLLLREGAVSLLIRDTWTLMDQVVEHTLVVDTVVVVVESNHMH